MKITQPVLLTVLLSLSGTTLAHEQENTSNAEQPDCKKMATMDHSKMQMDDPVMQAMMKQCAEAKHEHTQDSSKKKMDSMHHDHHEMMESKSSEKMKKSDNHDERNH